ncbi:hypothetical protein JCM10207_005832 [Rhodosporidiobolus poonsookiae]
MRSIRDWLKEYEGDHTGFRTWLEWQAAAAHVINNLPPLYVDDRSATPPLYAGPSSRPASSRSHAASRPSLAHSSQPSESSAPSYHSQEQMRALGHRKQRIYGMRYAQGGRF